MGPQEILRERILSQKPTDQQRDAIFAHEPEFVLRASPGSGKTWTSCRRFIWRAANWPHPAGGIALLSFTNAAVREFELAAIEVGQRNLLSDPNYLGTFDAFVERFVLAPFGHLICGSPKRPRLFTSSRPGDLNNKKLLAWTANAAGKVFPVPAWEIIPYLDNHKACFRASSVYGGKKLEFGERNPVLELMKLGYYTHSQRAFWACRLLVQRPHIAVRLAMRFPEIVVDEAQDTNVWLVVLLNFLRERGAKITLVGDPDQCIFAFAMADATGLQALKDKWGIPEKPLSRSFRCNNEIAAAVRHIGGNEDFTGRGDGGGEARRAFIVRETSEGYARSLTEFQSALAVAEISESSSAIICRAHEQLQAVRGRANYSKLRGIAKTLAEAAFFRDCRKDYKEAFDRVEEVLRSIIWDEASWRLYDELPESEASLKIRLEIWRFVKSDSGLPPVRLSASAWVTSLKARLEQLVRKLGVSELPNLGQKIQKRGLQQNQLALPLFQSEALFPAIRQETIHKVKGESIDGVLVLGSLKFWNSVLGSIAKGESCEDRRLAYVAMTRARDLLVVSLPARHFDNHSETWVEWGFRILGSA